MIVYEGKRTIVDVGADFYIRRADMEIRPYVECCYSAKQ